MDAVVSSAAEFVVVPRKLQSGVHLKSRQRPASMLMIEVVFSVLQKDADRLAFSHASSLCSRASVSICVAN